MRMWVHWKLGACVVLTVESLGWENFIDGAGWMLLERGGQMPELARVNGTIWGCLRRVL